MNDKKGLSDFFISLVKKEKNPLASVARTAGCLWAHSGLLPCPLPCPFSIRSSPGHGQSRLLLVSGCVYEVRVDLGCSRVLWQHKQGMQQPTRGSWSCGVRTSECAQSPRCDNT